MAKNFLNLTGLTTLKNNSLYTDGLHFITNKTRKRATKVLI